MAPLYSVVNPNYVNDAMRARNEFIASEAGKIAALQKMSMDDNSVSGGKAPGGASNTQHGTVVKEEAVTFVDNSDDIQEDAEVFAPTLEYLGSEESDILAFLRRPVKLYTFTWDVGNLSLSFDPWTSILADKPILRKLANFWMIKFGGLDVRIVCNGSPYQYGRYLIGYWPMIATDSYATTDALASMTKMSSLPYVHYVDPGADSVIEFHIPEFRNTQQNINAAPISLGLFKGLAIAGLSTVTIGGVSPYCDINFFVSAHNPQLLFKTTQLPYNGTSSEYKGVISSPLNKIAQVSGMLSKVPILSKYATPMETAAKLGASIAQLFGYSKPIDERQVSKVLNTDIGGTMNANGTDTSSVPLLDFTALSIIDPAIVGLPPIDEMVISHIVTRYSLIGGFTWADTNIVGDVLLTNMAVSPFCQVSTISSPYTPSNVAYITNMFQFWRGSLIYKFTFCASKFHSGRVQISYEPHSSVDYTSDITNQTKNMIVDLSETTEVEFEVPFVNSLDFRNCAGGGYWISNTNQTSSRTGVINVTCLSRLRCGTTSTVNVLVSIRAGSDYELSCPTLLRQRNTTSAATFFPVVVPSANPTNSGYAYYGTSKEGPGELPTLSTYHFSERVPTLRTLLKRYQVDKAIAVPAVANKYTYTCYRDFPEAYGYVPVYGSPGTVDDNSADFMNFFNYLAPSFVGWRGSLRYKFLPMNFADLEAFFATRIVDGTVASYMNGSTGITSTLYLSNSETGTEVVPLSVVGKPLEVVSPYQTNNNFYECSAYAAKRNTGNGWLISTRSTVTGTSNVLVMVAAGDDFNFLFYKGPPTFYTNTIG